MTADGVRHLRVAAGAARGPKPRGGAAVAGAVGGDACVGGAPCGSSSYHLVLLPPYPPLRERITALMSPVSNRRRWAHERIMGLEYDNLPMFYHASLLSSSQSAPFSCRLMTMGSSAMKPQML